ncbi:kinase-like protein [Morchella conica CCBAS932]|uniref:Kinase-like protein n=2 Tax=Morchella sect. Distantes TaxID=1051054 RepID=A0A3N4L0S9_9PEZI|nr:kinase-like protein [Morchella conica CCBAS932]
MSEAQKIIDTAFPSNSQPIISITELLDGAYNTSYLIELQGGSKYVLKIAPPPDVRVLRYENYILEAEASALQLIREKSSVPVPELVIYDDTCEILDSPYILMTYLPGVTLDKLRPTLSKSESDAIDHSVGQHMHQLGHAPAADRKCFGRGVDKAKLYTSWRECFLALTEAILRDGEDMLVLLPYEQLRQQFRKWAYTLDEVVQPQLAVLDFGDGSVLVDPQTKKVTGIIDFERAGWFDPLLSAAFRGPSAAFVEGYGKDVLDTRNKRCRLLMYSCYYSTIKIVETYYHQAEDSNEMEERKNLIKCLNSLVNWTAE